MNEASLSQMAVGRLGEFVAPARSSSDASNEGDTLTVSVHYYREASESTVDGLASAQEVDEAVHLLIQSGGVDRIEVPFLRHTYIITPREVIFSEG